MRIYLKKKKNSNIDTNKFTNNFSNNIVFNYISLVYNNDLLLKEIFNYKNNINIKKIFRYNNIIKKFNKPIYLIGISFKEIEKYIMK